MKRLIRWAAQMFRKHREGSAYLVFGVLTTAVNYIVFLTLHRLWGDRWILFINFLAFLAAVLFAYGTNKQFVFQSRNWSLSVVRRVLASFTAARAASFLIEEAGLWFAASVLHMGQVRFLGLDGLLLSKLLLNVIVVMLNYFFSKFFIFRNRN